MQREILKYPDERLRQVSAPIAFITDSVLELADDLFALMRHSERLGIGLAAPQVGEFVRMFVMGLELPDKRVKRYVCINPGILEHRGTMKTSEGCFSFGRTEYVATERAAEVHLSFTDRHGALVQKWFRGIEAVCVQHEIDHLDGKLMVDYGELKSREEAAE